MNLLKTKLRQTSAVVAGSLIGLSGVAVFAAPASAHAPVLKGETACIAPDAKTWTVNWAIANDYTVDANVTRIDARTDQGGANSDVTVNGVSKGTLIPKGPQRFVNGPDVPATTEVDVAAKWVELKVDLHWTDNYDRSATKRVERPATCEPTPPSDEPTKPSDEPTKPSDEPTKPSDEPTKPSETPSDEPTEEPTPDVPVPTPPGTEVGEPKAIFDEDCDTITIGLDNPANGVDLKLDYETSKGEKRSVSIAKGEKKSEKFSAKPGFWVKVTVTVTVEGETFSDFTKIDYEQPADCEGGSGGGLPVTGAAAGGIAGGAALLLIAGGVLFFMARRRKVKFTA